MKQITVVLSLLLALSPFLMAQTLIETEPVKELKPSASLGTCQYKPTSGEAPFFKKLAPKQCSTGSLLEDYDILKQHGYVSWYGIIRGISEVEGGRRRLLLEHKFFDGMTDCHIMLIDIFGSGDFYADIEAAEWTAPGLALVRVYGTIKEVAAGHPVLDAEFARVWPWMTFTFTNLTDNDRTNPRWKQVRSINDRDVYRPWPDENYYRSVLGNPSEYGPAIKDRIEMGFSPAWR
jgi:hypothetical protein